MVNAVTGVQRGFEAPSVRPAAGRSGFTAQLQQARMAPQTQDTVSLSTLSYQRRLEELQKLHENTDYSSMSYKDITLLIHNRFMDAFPNLGAMKGGLYLCAGENSIYEKVRSECDRHWTEATEGRESDRPPASDHAAGPVRDDLGDVESGLVGGRRQRSILCTDADSKRDGPAD